MSFVRAPNPIWYFVDLEGVQLDDNYYAHFLTNTLPYVPQPVYHDNQGTTPWDDPLEFYPNGTLPDNLYFDPDLVYRIEIRRGPSQFDPLIYEINDFVPGNDSSPPVDTGAVTTDNQVTNSQFAFISFTSPLSITTAGTYNIAPGWFLELVGTGTATITQVILPADADAINKPPYALRLDLSDWDEANLYQRLNGTGAIWASTTGQSTAVAATVTALAEDDDQSLSIIYQPSSGAPTVIASGTIDTAQYQVLQGAVTLPPSTNATLSNLAYVDLILQLDPTGIINISNFQVVGQDIPLPLTYQQESIERQADHLFHLYRQDLAQRDHESILVGWNFPLNPYQFITTAITTITNQTQYIADQTILHQMAASQVQTGQAGVAERHGLTVKAVTAATQTQVALIQYIDPATARQSWGKIVSIMARARLFTSHSTAVKLKARLIYRSSLPPTLSAVEPISSWALNGDPVFAAGWTAVSPLNDPSYVLQNAYEAGTTGDYPAIPFDQIQLPEADNASMTLGIVIYTQGDLDASAGTEDSIVFDCVSLTNTQFAADGATQTYDDCLKQCQFYYENSYSKGVLPGTAASTPGEILREQFAGAGGGLVFSIPRAFGLTYKRTKRASPSNVIFYSAATGAANTVRAFLFNNGVEVAAADVAFGTFWSGASIDENTINSITTNVGTMNILGGADNFPEGLILFHYVVDARLGV